MKIKFFLIVFFLSCSIILAQGPGPLPTDGLVGHWTFDDATNLELADVGNDLVADHLESAPASFVPMPGPEAGNGAVEIGLGSFYRCFHDIEVNGFDPAQPDLAPTRVNQYSLVIDFHIPQTGVWYSFYAGDNSDDPVYNDWEVFIRPSGALGVGSTGYSFYHVGTEGWYRLVIVADLGVQFKYYLDGQLTQDGSPRSLDDRFSLDSPDASNQVMFFGDNSGEDAPIYIAELALYDRPLTVEEVEALGGYGHFIDYGPAVGAWTFDDIENVLGASAGKDLNLVGEHAIIDGPSSEDGAVSVGVGSYYEATHDILANGFTDNATPTKTNRYTIAMDVRIAASGQYHALFQTNPQNIDDADLFIDPDGKIGSGTIGWTDSSIVKPGEWYRLAMTVSLGDTLPNVVVYADAEEILSVQNQALDGELALSPKSEENKVLFFADDNGEDNAIDVAQISLYNRYMSPDEVRNLGFYEHKFSTEVTPALKTIVFKKADNTQYARVPYSDDFDIPEGRDLTVECWIQIGPGISSDPAFISNKDWDSGGNNGWDMAAKDASWDVNIADTTRWRIDFDPPNINDGYWHHVGFVFDRTAEPDSEYIIVFTDDIYTVPTYVPADFGPCINKDHYPLCFGQDGTENYPAQFPGSLDEIRIWHAALTPDVLKEWRFKKVTPDHPNYADLVGYWKFDEGEGTVVQDQSGRGHDAEVINAATWKVSYAPLGNDVIQSQHDVSGIWGAHKEGHSGGLDFRAGFAVDLLATMAKNDNPLAKSQGLSAILSFEEEKYAVVGHNGLKGTTAADIPSPVQARYERIWYFDAVETFDQTVQMDFVLTSDAGVAENYVLLTRDGTSGDFTVATDYTPVVIGNKIMFAFVTLADETYFTLGTIDQNASPLGNLTNVGSINGKALTFELKNAYPNPFNPMTTIEYSLARRSDVQLTVFNSLGQQVAKLVDMKGQAAGHYKVTWSAQNMPSGVYFYRIEAGDFISLRKMILIK
ncbi:MAG: T9SS type A sorting domain-containing protein [Deltaproteobacteria bacterium]|nr:T9SS type A sorting domain-containing protein [Deltaproteobacteria bacterium]